MIEIEEGGQTRSEFKVQNSNIYIRHLEHKRMLRLKNQDFIPKGKKETLRTKVISGYSTTRKSI